MSLRQRKVSPTNKKNDLKTKLFDNAIIKSQDSQSHALSFHCRCCLPSGNCSDDANSITSLMSLILHDSQFLLKKQELFMQTISPSANRAYK